MQELELIEQVSDEWGDINVWDKAHLRILQFDDGFQQSSYSKPKPYLLQHDYTRAMCLALLWPKAEQSLVLGLGAGCLLQALMHIQASDKYIVVEQRRLVVDIAQQYFLAPLACDNVDYHIQSAEAYLLQAQQQGQALFGVIYSDLFHAQAMSVCQTQCNFFYNAKKNLSVDGVLVVNYWHEQGLTELPNGEVINYLKRIFSYVYYYLSDTSNWVIFASDLSLETRPNVKESLVRLSSKLEFDLQHYQKNLKPLLGNDSKL